tara:strand:- start:5036 stop:5338 length:303 start_codon:yes stop_codon:yes gene_type:complete
MKYISVLTNSFEKIMNKAELIDNIEERVFILEEELIALRAVTSQSWVSLEKAALEIGKSPSAIRQLIKNPKKNMLEGRVWKQTCRGGNIYINLKEFRKSI